MNESDREYYKQVWGFDPVAEKNTLNAERSFYNYEYFFPLENDPELNADDILIGARVEVRGYNIHNRVVFKNKMKLKEETITCIHTAIVGEEAKKFLSYSDQESKEFLEFARSTKWEPLTLTPEEHFVSLKSYVGGIADAGLMKTLSAAYQTKEITAETLPIGFNSALQKQVISALRSIAPKSTRAFIQKLLLNIVQEIPRDWVESRLLLLHETFDFGWTCFYDPDIFEVMDEAINSRKFRELAVLKDSTHPLIRERIFKLWMNQLSRFEKNGIETILKRIKECNPRFEENDKRGFSFSIKDGHLIKLIIEKQNLGEIPSEIWQFENLITLILTGNQIRVVPDDITRLSRLKYLGLSENNVESLPDSVFSLTELRDLSISKNRIKALPESLSRALKLETLNVTDNSIKELPLSLGSLKLLKKLFVGKNLLESLPDSIGTLHALKELTVNSNRLKKLPETFGNLCSLEQLWLNDNLLEKLPASIASLKELQYLDINRNSLKNLPDSFNGLEKLISLECGGNNLVDLAISFGGLKSLQRLKLDGNEFKNFPTILLQIKTLESLDISGNQPTIVSEDLAQLPSLMHLNLTGNPIKEIPPALNNRRMLEVHFSDFERPQDYMKRRSAKDDASKARRGRTFEELLQYYQSKGIQDQGDRQFLAKTDQLIGTPLELNNDPRSRGSQILTNFGKGNFLFLKNKSYQLTDGRIVAVCLRKCGLNNFPPGLVALPMLEYIDLSTNNISSFPDLFPYLQNLRILKLGCNKLKEFPQDICRLSALEELDLNGNEISNLSQNIHNLTNLKRLEISNNPLKVFPDAICNLTCLENLSINGTEISIIPPSIGNLKSLHSLSLMGNKFSSLPDAIGELQKLTNLRLEFNQLAVLPQSICQLMNMTFLGLENNHLTALPENIGNLKQLTHLMIRNNHLKSLPDSIGYLENLKYLFLQNNQLTSIPESITKLKNLQHIQLANPRPADLNQLERTLVVQILQLLLEKSDQITKKDEAGEIYSTSFPEVNFHYEPSGNISLLRGDTSIDGLNPNVNIGLSLDLPQRIYGLTSSVKKCQTILMEIVYGTNSELVLETPVDRGRIRPPPITDLYDQSRKLHINLLEMLLGKKSKPILSPDLGENYETAVLGLIFQKDANGAYKILRKKMETGE